MTRNDDTREDRALRALLRDAHAADRPRSFESVLAGRPRRFPARRAAGGVAALAAAAAVVVFVALRTSERAPSAPEPASPPELAHDAPGLARGAPGRASERLDLASARLLVASLAPPTLPASPFAGSPAVRSSSAPPRPLDRAALDALGLPESE